jgi:hypothetical protein
MTIRASTFHLFAAGWLAVAALGVSGTALADHHSGGGGGGGSHSSGGGGSHSSGGGGHSGGGGGHSSGGGHGAGYVAGHGGGGARPVAYASHAPAYYSPRGGYRAPGVPYHSNVVAPAARPWGGASASTRPVGATRAFAAEHGHGGWGRPGWYGRGHGGLPFYTYVGVIPWYCSTLWWGGVPYYFADNTYYLYDGNVGQYQVVPPPPVADQAGAEGAPAYEAGGAYVYPNNGQSAEQQSTDRYECHRWAVDQTGFDPTQSDGGVASGAQGSANDAYRRAEAACLAGRGYTVR